MPIHNSEIADTFETLANLLEIEDANPFRIRAYRNAARTIRASDKSMTELIAEGVPLETLPNIGKDLAEKINTIIQTGKLPLLEKTKTEIPEGLNQLLAIEGLGPKRVKALYQQLNISSIEDLKNAISEGKIKKIQGFGEKTEQLFKRRVKDFKGQVQRFKVNVAEEFADSLLRYLQDNSSVQQIMVAGSYRRCQETVGDLDILITTEDPDSVIAHFVRFDEIVEVINKGSTRVSVRLHSDLHVDLRVVSEDCYGAALLYFTGSKAHNIAVRRLATKKGYKINEYGVFEDETCIASKTELDVYKTVDLPYIEPELRENTGEIEAGLNHQLPRLITLDDIKGDLHCHTNASDGHHTLEQMVKAGISHHYEYISINDHSRRLTLTHGLDEKRLFEQIKAIDKLNQKLKNIVILKSIEVDILDDGRLDLSDNVLKELDFTLCAIHSKFNLSRQQQTDRILRAMDNPYFNILAHPTGRLINQREPYLIDLEKILLNAMYNGCILEINAQPERLDLNDTNCKMAKEIGVKMAISSDSHNISDLSLIRFGINQARRGWIEARDVINCLPLNELKKVMKRC